MWTTVTEFVHWSLVLSSVPDPWFWYGSGSLDPYTGLRIRILGSVYWITDPEPALFGSDFPDPNKKISFFQVFYAYFLL